MIKTLGGRRLGRTSSHKKSLLRTMAASLFLHERLETTIMKAKELRPYAERLITHAKHGKHYLVRREISDKTAYKKLFDVIALRYQERPGGYTQIFRTGTRIGDNADTGMIRLIP